MVNPFVDIASASKKLLAGEIIAYPTETVFGLAALCSNETALEKLQNIKHRDNKPFSVLLSNPDELNSYCTSIAANHQKLIDAFWPGPLTLVMPSTIKSSHLKNHSGATGFRCSSHNISSALARAVGEPITSTSANLSGCEPIRSGKELQAQSWAQKIHIIDGVCAHNAKPSTVIDLSSEKPKLLREGAIAFSQIMQYFS